MSMKEAIKASRGGRDDSNSNAKIHQDGNDDSPLQHRGCDSGSSIRRKGRQTVINDTLINEEESKGNTQFGISWIVSWGQTGDEGLGHRDDIKSLGIAALFFPHRGFNEACNKSNIIHSQSM